VTDKSTRTRSGNLSIPKASATELRGRQSIRVSFKLTRKCIEAMNILGSHLRLKPKSLFDHMVQEPQTLEAIAARARSLNSENQPRMAKTYVISRDAAEMLDAAARAHKVSRDALVETSVEHLMPLIRKEQVRHTARKNLASGMERHLKDGRKLLDDMVGELGDADPMCDKMRSVMAVYERAFASLSVFIQKGEMIEGFNSRD
jgi:hypothetical protein